MPVYTYKARESNGKLVRGSMDSPSKEQTASKLQKMGFVPTIIKEERKASSAYTFSFRSYFGSVRPAEMILFNLQLANMLNSGVNLLTSLKTMNKLIVNRRLNHAINEVTKSVAGGESLSQALKKHPLIFSQLFINMVRAGETGGELGKVLDRFAKYAENQEQMRQRIKNALFYPSMLFVLSALVVSYLVTFVLPQFMDIFTNAGVTLPLSTRILYSAGVMMREYWYFFIGGIIATIVTIRLLLKLPKVKRIWDKIYLKIPILGDLKRKVLVSHFSRSLGTLLATGVSVLQALDVTGDIVESTVISDTIFEARRSVEKGDSLIQAFTASEEYPADVLQMIAIGEETGKLTSMLLKISDFYDTLVEHTVTKLIIIIEPVFIIVLGGVVGLIMSAMILPMFDMIKTI